MSRRHRAAVLIPQADARLGQLVRRARGTRGDRGEVEAEIERGLVENRLRRRLGGDEDHAGAVGALVAAIADEERFFVRLQQPVDGDERVVVLVIDDVADSAWAGGVGDLAGRGLDHVGNLLERTIERLEDAIELQAHLERERPAGAVVGRNRRTAGILEVVRVILRLEHVEQVRAERLRALEDVGAGGILLARHRERRRRAMRGEAALDHDVDELGGGQEVAFARRQDVAARIAILGLLDDRVVLVRHGGDAPAANPCANRRRRRPSCPSRSRPSLRRCGADRSSSCRCCRG